jgi:hypothetical protein
MQDKMMLNEPLAKAARAPLTDVHDCSEHFYMTWCRGQPGKSPDVHFEFLARRADAVELRAYALVADVVDTMKKLAVKNLIPGSSLPL